MIKSSFADIPIISFDEIDSTNKYAVLNLKDIQSGFSVSSWIKTVILAKHQTAGRGRLDRTWLNERDSSLLASFIVDPKYFGTMLDTTLLITIINDVLNNLGVNSSIKWPNDLVVKQSDAPMKKLGGVLTEIAGDFLVIGVGININSTEKIEVENICSLEDFGVHISPEELLNEILSEITSNNFDLSHEEVLNLYKEKSETLNSVVRVETFNETFEGKVLDFSNTGALVLEMGDGRIIELSEGDITHLR